MTNSEKHIEDAFDAWAAPDIRQHALYGNLLLWFKGGWYRCNAMWEKKLDDGAAQLRSALYPNGCKHPQQGEWEWMIEEVKRMREVLNPPQKTE
tara:strand:+ start:314 stop:595 length:282 start_codon:yes stop_codon:yes gene_type:complete